MTSDSSILRTAKKTIEIEASALKSLGDCLGEDFVSAVKCMAKMNGRAVLTGIGKSALVAKKITATLNSTGTPSLFMHAADAIHGDLGMIRGDDVVICLSKSGDTPEIKVLIPLLKNNGNITIGMSANPRSFLGKNVDFLLLTPIDQEADPNNLAPTASTTSQMALGDAIAVCLLGLRGFSPSDFARFHPGGMLGKQLYLTVGDLADNNEKPRVDESSDVKDVLLAITSGRLGATAVVNASGQLRGIITDGDLRRMMEQHGGFPNLAAHEIMTSGPTTVNRADLAMNALHLMREKSISQVIVTENDQYAGMVHLHDLVREGLI